MKLAHRWLSTGLMLLFASMWASPLSAWQISISPRVMSPPETPNMLVHLDVPELRKMLDGDRLGGALAESVKSVDAAVRMDVQNLVPEWEFGEVRMSPVPTLQQVADAGGGYLDSVGRSQVVWLPRQEYVLPAGSDGLILVRPADRQRLARWLSGGNRAAATSYLKSAAASAPSDAALWMAVDLEGAISPRLIRDRLATVEALQNNAQALDTLSELFGSLRGVQVLVLGADSGVSELSFDFGQSPQALALVAKPMFAEAMERRDVSLPNFDEWTAKVEGNSLKFQGPVAAATVDNLLSLLTIHQEAGAVETSVEIKKKVEADADVDPMALATKEYFNSVRSIVKRVRDYSAQTTGSRAHWNDKMSRQIDNLSTLNVAPEAIEYGREVSDLLRGSGQTIRTANIAAGAEKMQTWGEGVVNYGGYYGGGNYGYGNYYGWYNSVDYDRAVDGQARAMGMQSYREAMSQIDTLTRDTRIALEQKYQIQF